MKRETLEKKTVAELRAMAKRKGLSGYSVLKKDALVDLLARGSATKRAAAQKSARSATKRAAGRKSARSATKRAGRAAGKKSARGAARKPGGAKKSPVRPSGRGPEVDAEGSALSPRVLRAFSVVGGRPGRARRNGEQRVKASKYYLGVEKSPELDEEFSYPDTYGESMIALMVKDPYWLFAYWQFAPDIRDHLEAIVGPCGLDACRLVLRVYDVTDAEPENSHGYHDVDVARGARDWYINVMRVEREYCVDIGLLRPDGSFIVIARSNRVTLPPVGPSDAVDEEWVTLEALAGLYEQSTGGGPSSGSGGWGPGGGGT